MQTQPIDQTIINFPHHPKPKDVHKKFGVHFNGFLNNIEKALKNRPFESPVFELEADVKEQGFFFDPSDTLSGFSLIQKLIVDAFRGDESSLWQAHAMFRYNQVGFLSNQTKEYFDAFTVEAFNSRRHKIHNWLAYCLGSYIHLYARLVRNYMYIMDEKNYANRTQGMSVKFIEQSGLSRPARWVIEEDLKTLPLKLLKFSKFIKREFGLSTDPCAVAKEVLSVLLYRISLVRFQNSPVLHELVCVGYSQSFANAFFDNFLKQMRRGYQIIPDWKAVVVLEKGGNVSLRISYHPLPEVGEYYVEQHKKAINSMVFLVHSRLNAYTNALVSKTRMSNKNPILFSFEEV